MNKIVAMVRCVGSLVVAIRRRRSFERSPRSTPGVAARHTPLLFACAAAASLHACAPVQWSERDWTARPGPNDAAIDQAVRSQEELQATLMGFADTYIALKSQAADNAALAVTMQYANQPEAARLVRQLTAQATRSKLEGAEAVVQIVTGPSPNVALLDLAVMVTIEHEVWTDFWSERFGPEASYNMMDVLERLENEIWAIASEELTETEVSDLRQLAAGIRQQYITQVFVTSLRASRITRTSRTGGIRAPKSLLALMGLDPLGSLAPAVREVTESRLLAERMYYFAQKAPMLVQWRTELLLNRAFDAPDMQLVLNQLDAMTSSVNHAVALVDRLPDRISNERTAAIDQAGAVVAQEVDRLAAVLASERAALLDGVSAEREAALAAFDDRHETMRLMLVEARNTADAATALSDSVGRTVERIDALQGDPDPDTQPGRPFDVREYRDVSESLTQTIHELNTLLVTAEDALSSSEWSEREAQADRLLDQIESRVLRLVFWAAGVFGGAVFVSLTAVLLVQRSMRGRS